MMMMIMMIASTHLEQFNVSQTVYLGQSSAKSTKGLVKMQVL